MIIYKLKLYNETHILLRNPQNHDYTCYMNTLKGIQYASEYSGWIIPYTREAWAEFLKLGLPYKTDTSGTTGHALPLSVHAGTQVADFPQSGTREEADTSDISVRYQHPYFFIRGLQTELIPYIKSLQGSYWNSRYKNWVIPARTESLQWLNDNQIITEQQYLNWTDHIHSISDPQKCILYSSPEYPDHILLQLKGHGIDVDYVKHIPERRYSEEGRFWVIPHKEHLITRISDHYQALGVCVIRRIMTKGHHKKETNYRVIKKYLIAKTPSYVHYATLPYIETLISQSYSLSTIKEYYYRFSKFAQHIFPEKCDHVREEEINSFISQMNTSRATESLVNSYINAIKFYYEKVVFIPDMKLERVKRPRKGHPLPKVLSVQQVDKMLRATQNIKHVAMLYALYGHGLRLNELLGLRLEDLLWDRNQVFINKGKGYKDRYIPMSQEFKELIKTYIHEFTPQYWLFEGRDQQSPYSERSVQEVVRSCARKAGITMKVTPHMLRHSYATHLMDCGTQLPYVKELLGHKDIKTTMVYTHVTTARIENVISPLDRLRSI